MFKNILLFCFVFCPFICSAQLDSFDISTYARPDLKRRTLQVSPDFNFSFGRNSASDLSSHSTFADLDLRYFSFVNSVNTQKSTNAFFDMDIRFRKTTGANKILTLSPDMNWSQTNRIFHEPKRFLELNYSIVASDQFTKQDNTENTNRLSTVASVGIFKGWGRIEYINDAWQAISMLKEFRDTDLLIDDLSSESVTAFANEIANIKNERVLDNRLKRIYELENLETYLEQNEIVYGSSIRFFSTLNDQWNYENFTQRYHGSTFKIGITPSLSIFKPSNPSDSSNTLLLSPSIAYDKYSAIDENWQFNQNYSVGLYYTHSALTNTEDQSYYSWYINTQASIAYYQNFRNYYVLSYNLNYSKYYRHSFLLNQSILGEISLAYVKYISPSTQFVISSELNNNSVIKPIGEDSRLWDYVFAIRLNHYIY